MKNLITLLLAASIGFASFAQTSTSIPVSQIPANVQHTLQMHYPSVSNASWQQELSYFQPVFTYNGARVKLLIDLKGTLIHTSTQIDPATLPASTLAYLNGQTVADAEKLIMINGTTRYEAVAGGKDMIFDANGRFIKIVTGPLKQ